MIHGLKRSLTMFAGLLLFVKTFKKSHLTNFSEQTLPSCEIPSKLYLLAGPCRIAYLAGLKRSPLMFAVVNLRDVCYSCLAIFD